jgi:molybdopterin converting factor small subunit
MVKSPVKKKVEVIELAEEKIMREMREVKERKEEEKRRKEGLKKLMIVETEVKRVDNDTSMSKGDEIDFNQYIS